MSSEQHDALFTQVLHASQAEKSQHFEELGKEEKHLSVHPWWPQKPLLSVRAAADFLTQLSGRISCDEIFGKLVKIIRKKFKRHSQR